jgi:hypothetical protein
MVRIGQIKSACTIFVGKPEIKRHAGRYRCRWDSNIKLNNTDIGLRSADLISLTQESSCEHGNEQLASAK